MFDFKLLLPLAAAMVFASSSRAAVTVRANFTDGNDNTAPTDAGLADPSADSFGGAATNGWATPWTSYVFGTPTAVSEVADAKPFDSTSGNYLQYDFSGASGAGLHLVRQYANAAAGGIDTSAVHTTSFQLRLDTDADQRSTTIASDYIRIFDSTTAGSTSSTTTGWLIQSAGGTADGDWALIGGDGLGTGGTAVTSTGIAPQQGVVYSFTVTVHPVSGTFNLSTNYPTWDATISGGGQLFSATGLRFRDNLGTSGRFLEFGGGVNSVERLAYSVDNISISSVPEPSAAAAVTLAAVGLLVRRRDSSHQTARGKR